MCNFALRLLQMLSDNIPASRQIAICNGMKLYVLWLHDPISVSTLSSQALSLCVCYRLWQG